MKRPVVYWLLTVAPAFLVSLHATAILPLAWQTVPLTAVQPVQGTAYVATLDTDRFPPAGYPPDPADVLLENAAPSRYPPMPGWGVVATQGMGRYHVGPGAIYFSAFDNSDPRANGRHYAVRRPWPVRRGAFLAAWAIALLGTLLFAALRRRQVFAFLARPPFWVVTLLMFLAVAANRFWLFTDYPLVAIHPDSGSYYSVAEQLGTGTLPKFGWRPPVYPVFLRLTFMLVDRALFLSFCQMLLAYGAAVLLVYGAYRWKPGLALPAAAWMALYLFSVTAMEHDSAMLSESLYATCLMFGFGALVMGLGTLGPGWLALASTGFALAILTRPAGMFLVVSYLLVAAWLVWRPAGRRAIAAFMIPFPLLLVSMSVYNMRVVRAFTPTTWGEANLAVATFLYWEQDPAYPADINQSIQRIREIIAERYVVTNLDRGLLDRTWDPEALAPIFVQSFNGPALDVAMRMGGDYDTVGRRWIRRIAFDSIAKHPDYYAKFFVSMMYLYFKPASEFDFRAYLLNRAYLFYVVRQFSPENGDAFMVRLGKEFATGMLPAHVIITDRDPKTSIALSDRILLPATRGWRVYFLTHAVRRVLAPTWFWSIGFGIMLVTSTTMLAVARFRHDGAFLVFIVTISAFGAALVVSMVEYSQPRYSHPMEWTYGLSLVMLPLLFMRSVPGRAAAG